MLDKLRKARKAAGLTQAQMGQRLGLTMAGYRQKESGERKISVEEANAIANILHVSLDDIFFQKFPSD